MGSITGNLSTLLNELGASGRGVTLLVAFAGLIAFSLGAVLINMIGEYFDLAFDTEEDGDGYTVRGVDARGGRRAEREKAHSRRTVRMAKSPHVSGGELVSGSTRAEEARVWDHVANSPQGGSQPVWDYGEWGSPDKRVFGDRD